MRIPGNENTDKVVDECARLIADSIIQHGFRELRGVVYQVWQILATEQERAKRRKKS